MGSGSVEQLVDFFEHGYLELAANGIRANVSLELSLLPDLTAQTDLLAELPISRIKPVSVRWFLISTVLVTSYADTCMS